MLQPDITRSDEDLHQILALQKQFLREVRSRAEENDQGFLTVAHSFEELAAMHSLEPSILVRDGKRLAGYALVMPRACGQLIPLLVPMFNHFDHLHFKGRPLNQFSFYAMGQICVDKPYRGQGIFRLLYEEHRRRLSGRFELVVSEISTRNRRSQRAHENVGFQTISVYRDEVDEWNVVAWDWSTPCVRR